MRIPLTELYRPKTVTLKGNEEWLNRIYGDFPLGKERPLAGELQLTIGDGNEVNVTGTLEFAPTVPCSRCETSISWPLKLDVKARFLPERGPESKRDITLTEADLDAYYIEMGAVDLEQLLTDLVQTAMPTQFVRASADGSSCLVCDDDLARDLVYGKSPRKQPEKPASPFAALKDLKLKN